MKMRQKILAPLAAVIGFSLAIMASSASAGPAWGSPTTTFEDDNVDFLIKGEGNTQAGIIEVGDLVASVIEFNDSAGSPIQPEELTGLAIFEVAAILDLDGFGGLNDIVFQPATSGFDSYSGIAPLPNGAGAAGSGGMFALWLDDSPDLAIDAGTILAGSPSCTTYAGCVAQATDGDSWMVAGFGADPDNSWTAFNAYLDTGIVDITNPSIVLGSMNAGLSVLFNNTGQVLIPNDIGCAPFCGPGPGGDGKVDMVAGLSIKGGGELDVPSDWFATSDLDMTLSNEPNNPGIDIEKLTNGNQADGANDGDVPQIAPGDTVTWTYIVTNTGNTEFTFDEVVVTDDQVTANGVTPVFVPGAGTDDSDGFLSPGEIWHYTATLPAENLLTSTSGVTIVPGCDPDQNDIKRPTYENIGTVVAGSETDFDPSHYCNPPEPGIDIEKLTNGNQADGASDTDVPQIVPSDTVTWTYIVTNTGGVAFAFADVVVTDNQPGVAPVFVPGAGTDDGDTFLSPGEVWHYTADLPAENLISSVSGATIVPGCDPDSTGLTRPTYENTGTVMAGENTDFDPSHYCNPPEPGIDIEKLTNGNQADGANDSDVPVIAPSDTVTWTYVVTNTGNVPFALADVSVTDDQPGVSPEFVPASDDGDNILSPGEEWLYTATLLAENLMNSTSGATIVPGCDPGDTGFTRDTYENIGTVVAGTETDEDPSHYCNPAPGIDIEKLTNGNQADGANDNDVPQIVPGDDVTWTYIVTNTGGVAFAFDDVVVTDDQFAANGVVPVFVHGAGTDDGDGFLSPGEVWHYTATLPAEILATTSSGVTIVPGCDPGNTGNTRETYENLGTVVAGTETDSDPSHYCNPPDVVLGCRLTGGLNATYDTGNGVNRYTGGGQVGANTGGQPQPKGEWTHHQQNGPAGDFTFHGGTASAAEGTEIHEIRCSDPGGCGPSGNPPSPVKQLDFDGIGTFKNIGKQGNKVPDFVAGANVTAEGHGNKDFDGTFHWFEVNIDDLGEPGNTNPKKNPGDADPNLCPVIGFGEKGAPGTENSAVCECSDFHRITIYDGVNAADIVKNPDGSIDPSQLNRTDVIYEVWGPIDGGNYQIHHPTGFDRKQ